MAFTLSLLWAASAEAQATRVGYVDSNAVLAEYAPAQEARQQLEDARQDAEAELQLLGSGWQTAVAEYEQQAMSMTPEARQNRQQELAAQQQALQTRTQELEIQFQQRREIVLLTAATGSDLPLDLGWLELGGIGGVTIDLLGIKNLLRLRESQRLTGLVAKGHGAV